MRQTFNGLSVLAALLCSIPAARANPAALPELLALAGRSEATPVEAPASRPVRDESLRVMSYNLRYADDEQPNAWSSRRPVMKAMLDAYSPDVIGTQEGLYDQLQDIAADHPGYAWLGRGNSDGKHGGEHTAVFYRRERLEPLASGAFWLSDTPEVAGTTSWGNTVIRMVTWVRFRDRRTGRSFQVFNTHLDHEVQISREKSAALIRKRIASVPAALPIALTGDFNVPAANKVHDILADNGGLKDSWFEAKTRVNEDADSFQGFGPLPRSGRRIDWILTRGDFEVRSAELVTYGEGGQWPSDHLPLVVQLAIH